MLTLNLLLAEWDDVFGYQFIASAMTVLIVHHAEIVTLRLQLPSKLTRHTRCPDNRNIRQVNQR
jgi:DNA replication protein DnaC